MSTAPENLLVIERAALGETGLFQGLSFETGRFLPRLLDPRFHRFVPRPDAEHDPSLKQLIPYFVICNGDRTWCYRRGSKPGEKRLADRYSIGVGGHINDCDRQGDGGIYQRAALRELHEEIVVPSDARHEIAALLNDDSNAVGQVHLGIVHVLLTDDAVIVPREETIREAGFKTLSELAALRPSLETWSQIVFDGLTELRERAGRLRS